MKRFFVIIALLVAAAATVSSCKSHERCPAYGKLESNNPTEVRV